MYQIFKIVLFWTFMFSAESFAPFAQNEDIYKTTPEFLIGKNFQHEEHEVTTDDGYILKLFRCVNPCKRFRRKPYPVLMAHQFQFSSDQWFLTGSGSLNKDTCLYTEYHDQNTTIVNNCKDLLTSNLALTLCSCGYDVWFGNSRGNQYSNKHQIYSFDSPQFWNYSLTELGLQDTKKSIEYVLNHTNKDKISYIGSSLGTTQMFTLLSLEPTFERYIQPFISIPPIVFLKNTQSIVKYATFLVPILKETILGLGIPNKIMQVMAEILRTNKLLRFLAQELAYRVVGYDPLFSGEIFVSTLAHYFQYVSSRIFLQFGQFITDGGFHQFDYMDQAKNLVAYGVPYPPAYPLENITSPNMYFYRGKQDTFEVKTALDTLISKLTVKPADNKLLKNAYYNHIDFIVSLENGLSLNKNIFLNLRNAGNKSK